MLSFIRQVALILLFFNILIIILRELFAMLLMPSILFIKNITLAPILQVIINAKFVPFLKILKREAF
jgi:hypothetical protein